MCPSHRPSFEHRKLLFLFFAKIRILIKRCKGLVKRKHEQINLSEIRISYELTDLLGIFSSENVVSVTMLLKTVSTYRCVQVVVEKKIQGERGLGERGRCLSFLVKFWVGGYKGEQLLEDRLGQSFILYLFSKKQPPSASVRLLQVIRLFTDAFL